jgi:hypothetical protein
MFKQITLFAVLAVIVSVILESHCASLPQAGAGKIHKFHTNQHTSLTIILPEWSFTNNLLIYSGAEGRLLFHAMQEPVQLRLQVCTGRDGTSSDGQFRM